MSSNEMRQLIAHLPAGVDADLIRYGVSVDVLEVECIQLLPITDLDAEAVPTVGCEVIDMPVEVIHYDLPAFPLEAAYG